MANVRKISRKYYLRQIVSCCLVWCMFFVIPARIATAEITGGDVVEGSATITGGGINDATINMLSDRAVINWDSFDTDIGQLVQFLKESGNFAVLNRIIGEGGATHFNGNLEAFSGDVFIVNTRGVFFGPQSYIQARNFVASGIDITNDNFMDGIYRFEQFAPTLENPYSNLIGDVTNEGIGTAKGINAQNIALIGKSVTNKGTLRTTAPGGAVVMAAGETVYLSEIGSDIVVEVTMTDPTEHIVDNGGDLGTGDGTIEAEDGIIILAAGDIYSAAISGIETLRAEAMRDITLTGTISANDDITLVADADENDGGDVSAQELNAGDTVDISASDDTINLHADVTADFILLNDHTVADAGVTLDAGQDVIVGDGTADGTRLTGNGELTVQADRDIILGGDVEAAGKLILKADADTLNFEPGGTVGGIVLANGDVETTAGNIEISGYSIVLDGDLVDAADDLILNNNTKAAAGMTLKAGNNVNSKAHLIAVGDLTIEATEGEITAHNIDMDDDYKTLTLIQKNKLDLEQNIETWDNRINTHLVAESTGDSVTSEAAAKWLDIEATAYENIVLSDESGNITTKSLTTETGDIKVTAEDGKVYAEGSIDAGRDAIITATNEGLDGSEDAIFLTGVENSIVAGRDIWLNNNTWAADGYLLDAGQDVRIGWQGEQDPWDPAAGYYAPKTLTGAGELTIEANRHITLGGDVVTEDDLTLWADKDETGDPGGDMTALGNIKSNSGSIDIYASDSTIILSGDLVEASIDVTLHNNTVLNGGALQTIEATNGKLTAEGYVHKTTTGDLEMFGGYNINNWPTSSVWTQDVTVDDGKLSIKGNANVRLDGSIYSSDDMELAANQDGDVLYDNRGNLIHYGDTIKSLNGEVDMSASGGWITLDGGINPTDAYVSAGDDILLRDDVWVQYSRKLDAGDDIVLAAGESISANGGLTVIAGDDIIIGSTDVDNHWLAPEDDTGLRSNVTANGDLTLSAGDDVYSHGDLIATGDIDIYSSDSTTYLSGDLVQATGDVTLHNNTELNGSDQRIEATTGKLTTKGYVHKTSAGNLEMFGGFDGPLGLGDYSVMTKEVKVDDGSTDGELRITGNAFVLLDGDIYSRGRMELTSNADGDEIGVDAGTLEHASGAIKSLNNDVDIDALNSRILLNGGVDYDPMNAAATTYVSAGGDILLYASTSVAADRKLYAGDDVALAADKRIVSNGDLIIEAGDDILLGISDVTNHWLNQDIGSGGHVTTNGGLTLIAGDDIHAHGKLTTTNTDNGDMLVEAGDNIDLYDDATSAGKMTIHAGYSIETEALTTINPDNGDIDVHSEDFYTNIYGPVNSAGNLRVQSDSDDVELYDYIDVAGNATLMAGGHIELARETGAKSMIDGDFHAQANYNIELYGDVEAGGNITLDAETQAVGDILAGKDLTVTGGLTLFGEWYDYDEFYRYYGHADQTVEAGRNENGTLTAESWVWKTTPGHLYLLGNNDDPEHNNGKAIDLQYDGCLLPAASTALGNLELYAENGDIQISGDLSTFGISDDGLYLCDWYDRPTGGVSVIAENGKIYTEGAGEEGEYMLNIAISGNSDHYQCLGVDLPWDEEGKAAIVILSREDLIFGPETMLVARGNYYDAGGISIWDLIDFTEVDSYEDYFDIFDELFEEKLGGCIGGQGAFCSAVYEFLGDLDEAEFDFGDQEAFKALFTDFVDEYFEDILIVDDRPGAGLLAEPLTTIGGYTRDEGEPIDVAIYAGSMGTEEGQGNVHLDGRAIDVAAEGTMVVDAYDTVTFGDLDTFNLEDLEGCDLACFFMKLAMRFHEENLKEAFDDYVYLNGRYDGVLEDFLNDTYDEGFFFNIDRLEVVSRLTEWLYEALEYGTLPYPYNPEIVEAFIGGDYILRGAGLGNPFITDGRAWVLEDPFPAPPLYREAGEASDEQEFGEGGCPALMNWLAVEIGVPADEIQVVVEGAFALSTDIQPCEMCARLMAAANTLEDPDGTQISAMIQVLGEFVTTPAPPSPEQMTAIASALSDHVDDGTYYASAGEWVDALVAYVSILNTEMGYSATDATALANKYLTPVTEAGNATLTAYVQARLAALGG